MKVKIFSKNSNWTTTGVLIRENEIKIFIWATEKENVEFHFPKHSHYYEPIKDLDDEK